MWACLTLFPVYYGYRVRRGSHFLFSPPLVLSLLLWGIFVKSYFEFDEQTLAAFLDTNFYSLTLLYTVFCLTAFCVLFERASGVPGKRSSKKDIIDNLSPSIVALFVAAIAVIGLSAQFAFAERSGGLLAFYSEAHGSAGAYSTTSAYLHALPTFLWPALLMCYVFWFRGVRYRRYYLALFLLVGIALFAHTFLFGNRNGVIRFCLIIGGAYVFLVRPSLQRALPLIGLLLVAVGIVLVLPHIREHLHLGSEVGPSQALLEYLQQESKPLISPERGGHELFFNVAVIQSAAISSTYDYGAAYIYPFINFIPRFWWPDKPYEIEFGVNIFTLTQSVTGWYAGNGAAVNAVAHSFLAFSWLGWVPWLILGYWSGREFRAVADEPSLLNLGKFLSVLLGVVYWGTQSFSAFFFNWFFMIVPFYGLMLVAPMQRLFVRRRRFVVP